MKKSKAIIPLWLAVFTDLVGFGIVLPVLPGLFLDPTSGILPFGTSQLVRAVLLGALLALFPLIQMFSAPMLGALADRHGRKPILLLSFLGTLVGYVLFAVGIMTGQLWLLIVGRVIDGATGGNISVAQASIADLSTERTRAKYFGLIGMAFGLGFIIGPFLGGKLSDPSVLPWFNYATPFWFAAVLCALNVILLLTLLPETLKERIVRPVTMLTGIRNVRLAFTLPRLRLLFFVNFLLMLGFTVYTSYFQVYLISRFNMPTSAIGTLFGFTGLCIALSQGLIAGPVSNRVPPNAILRSTIFGAAVTIALTLYPSAPSGLYLVIPFMAVFQGLVTPNITALISSQADAESQGEILGINQSVSSFAQFLPGFFGGAAAAWYAGLPTWIAAGLTFIAGIVFLIGYKDTQEKRFRETS
jgi:DHA1 family tetracycline resistance protein-like MFS transporter